MSELPLVSVIAVCYNHAKYVVETLDSIKKQTYQNIELIIIDSNSQDDSVKSIQKWIDRNNIQCSFIKQTEPKNISQNLNKGLQICKGEFIQVIATDDKLLPTKISLQAKYLMKNSECGVVFSNSFIMDEFSVKLKRLYKDQDMLIEVSSNNSFNELIYRGSFIIPHSALIRRNVYERVGQYDENLTIEDWDFFLRVFKENIKVHFIKEILVFYRISQKSLWNTKNFKLFKSQIKTFQKHNMFELPIPMNNYLTMFSRMKFLDICKGAILLTRIGQVKWAKILGRKYYKTTLIGRGVNKLGRITKKLLS